VQLFGWPKAQTTKPRKQRRNLKQIHEDLKELGYEGAYDRGAGFARQWKAVKQSGSILQANENFLDKIDILNQKQASTLVVKKKRFDSFVRGDQ
jgi:hypothetical protein